jgi:hypothetical protein
MLYKRKPQKKTLKDKIVDLIHKIEFGKELKEYPVNLQLRIYNKDLQNQKNCKKIFYIIRVNEKVSILKVLSNIDTVEYVFYNRDKFGDTKQSFVDLEVLFKWEWAELIKLLKEINDFDNFEKYILKNGSEFYNNWK